jgi:branched-chain amino acid transport system substrate-binding protein
VLPAALAGATPVYAQANEQFIPVLSLSQRRLCAEPASVGKRLSRLPESGQRTRQGINGVKITYEECETGYATDRGVECYAAAEGQRARPAPRLQSAVDRHHLLR